MSQYGATRSFKTAGGGYIRVIAHVDGELLQQADIIDDLALIHVSGDMRAAGEKLKKLKEKWVGRKHREWRKA